MRTRRAWLPLAIVAIQPVCLLAASYHFPVDPVGMGYYRSHLPTEMLPLALIPCLFLAAVVARYRAHRKAKKQVSADVGLQHD